VKAATDNPETGRTVQKTTVTTILPADPASADRKTPEFWEYLEKLTASDWDKHILYVYRRFDSGPSQPLEKCVVYFVMPDGTKVPLNNREEFEIAMAQTYGGGSYRLWLKRGAERITEGRLNIDGPPKNTQPGILRNLEQAADTSQPASASNDVATTAMHLVANHEGEGIRIGIAAMQSAADVLQRVTATPASPSETDHLMRQAMVAMLNKALNPPDPLETFARLMTLMQTGQSAANGESPMVTKILEAGLERVLNPAPSGPVSSTGAELVRSLPQIISYATEAAREWRVGSEAQLKTAQIMAGPQPAALPPGTAQGQTQPPARPITQATQVTAPPPEPQVMPAGAPSLEFIESKIVEILKKPISADDSADEVLAFLDLMAPAMVDQLAACSEAQLVQIFQTRPVLRQYHDLARLQEFIRSFLKFSKDEAAPDVDTTSKPN
jgi:hypothetical protein